MMSRPISLVAERAVRLLRRRAEGRSSLDLAGELLATRCPDERAATRLLRTAFGGDPRLRYARGTWRATPAAVAAVAAAESVPGRTEPEPAPEPVRTLIHVTGESLPGRAWALRSLSVLRLQGDEVLAACGGDAVTGPSGNRLRRAVLETLDAAVPVIHDPPGALRALEQWLGEPIDVPISLRRLGQERVGLPASHTLEELVARLGLSWRDTDDPLELADTLDACLVALRQPGEKLQTLRGSTAPAIDWSRLAFDREFLRTIPSSAGTYRFFDVHGRLLYVGKSNNLNRRIGSYFREPGRARPARVQKLLDALYRIEYDAVGSDLEAMLQEAEQIRRREPERNVQRELHPRGGRAARLRSILILEPAAPPLVLRAFLIRHGRLIERVGVGPRGGGLSRIRRVLEDHFFFAPEGPRGLEGPDLDVELVARWLAANRDRVVAFDPTDLRGADEVVERLRWFLGHGSPFDPEGFPILSR